MNRRLEELDLPQGLIVTTVIRRGAPMPATEAGRLEVGDQLLLLSSTAGDAGEAEVQAVFQG